MLLATSANTAPVIERATKGERCVEDTANMRRNHMRFLEHQRDATVHGGIRGTKHSLKGCIDCHASRTSGSVAAAPGDFCVSCHAYAAVKVDCFDCHATKRALVGAR
ncbi:MAG: Hdr-like menaquinol oxidoreductase cytochrome c subunit [Burkholderiales bacterium]|nr:Hdr-like menaquinol oxidoreductase cytochrome c subunit [Burkholderiales bacterium]